MIIKVKKRPSVKEHLNNALESLAKESCQIRTYSMNEEKREATIVFEAANGELVRQTMKIVGKGVVNTNTKFPQDLSRGQLSRHAKELRKEGFTQSEIAQMLGCSQGYISRLLNPKEE